MNPPYTVEHKLYGHSAAITTVLFSPSGDSILSCGEDGNIFVWDATTGLEIHRLRIQTPACCNLATWISWDSNESNTPSALVCAYDNGTIALWSIDIARPRSLATDLDHESRSAPKASFIPHQGKSLSAMASHNNRVATAARGEVHLYSVASVDGNVFFSLRWSLLSQFSGSIVSHLSFFKNGDIINVSYMYEKTLLEIDTFTGKELRRLLLPYTIGLAIPSNVGDQLIIYNTKTGLNVIDLLLFELTDLSLPLPLVTRPAICGACCDASTIITHDEDQNIYIWDSSSGILQQTIHSCYGTISCIAGKELNGRSPTGASKGQFAVAFKRPAGAPSSGKTPHYLLIWTQEGKSH
ncbi:hypothetical protein Hypma_005809 [Hypsizygus marmoreus]|uniref:Uncharacterized protein n=1 Tax=Hypsizygus marmoreus TaxID=39966 RepID=A0A369K858_HYPMA|nr:hypothetical protein Hypma_005809 [Hypsizygus marmoreus]